MTARNAGLLFLTALILATGCSKRDLRPLNPCTITGVVRKVSAENIEELDLLLMVDNSNSMAEEQAALRAEFPRIVQILVSGDQTPEDGITQDVDFPAIKSLRVGVVSSDMGVLGVGVIDAQDGMVSPGVNTCGRDPMTGDIDTNEAQFGDDGEINLLSPESATLATEGITCEANYDDPGTPERDFLTFTRPDNSVPTTAEINQFSDDVSCTAVLGTGGCGFEMQLESILKALTPSTSSLTFAPDDSAGQGDRANAGFLRQNAVLAILAVTDEDDCSTDNPEIFMRTADDTSLQDPNQVSLRFNTRCTFFDDQLYPISRYVDGLLALKEDPNKIIFGAIAGVPLDLTNNPNAIDLEAILADPRMDVEYIFQNGVDLNMDGNDDIQDRNARVFQVPACWRCIDEASGSVISDSNPDSGIGDVPGFQSCSDNSNQDLQQAVPAIRITQVADALNDRGSNGVVQSICQDDFSDALNVIISRVADVLKGACLPRPLNPDATGEVNCDVVEILPDGATCANREGAGRNPTPVRVTEDGQEVCQITQLVPTASERTAGDPPAVGIGWYYDDYTTEMLEECGATNPQRISFTDGAEPFPGSDIRLECLQPVQGGGLDSADISSPCTTDTDCHMADAQQMNDFVTRYNLDRTVFIEGNDSLTAQPMFCESQTRTCQIACQNDAECPGGFVCADPNPDDSNPDVFCVNPTCPVDSTGDSTGGGDGGT